MNISVDELYQRLNLNRAGHVIDVRSEPEFKSGRPDVRGIRNVPLERIESLPLPREAEIYVTCLTGKRSEMAQMKLKQQGYKRVINVMGGYVAWKHAGYSVAKG